MLIGITGKKEDGRELITKILNEEDKYQLINIQKVYFEIIKNVDVQKEFQEKLNIQDNNKEDLHFLLYCDEEKRRQYNTIIWKYLEKEIDRLIEKSTKPVIIEWDKLPLTKYYDECDIKILVDLNKSVKEKLGKIISENVGIIPKNKKEFIDRNEAMNHLFYNGNTDFQLNYNEKDMDFIIDNNYFNNGIEHKKVKKICRQIELKK